MRGMRLGCFFFGSWIVRGIPVLYDVQTYTSGNELGMNIDERLHPLMRGDSIDDESLCLLCDCLTDASPCLWIKDLVQGLKQSSSLTGPEISHVRALLASRYNARRLYFYSF